MYRMRLKWEKVQNTEVRMTADMRPMRLGVEPQDPTFDQDGHSSERDGRGYAAR